MRNIKLILEFDGTDFQGWQSQAQGERTVQDTLAACIEQLVGHEVKVMGSGRTDSGVHALGLAASFETDSAHDTDTIRRALNAMLPHDVRVLGAQEATPDFHPVRDALSKRYIYFIANMQKPPAFIRRYAWCVPHELDAQAMRKAAGPLAGTHDFSAFMAAGSDVRSTIRTVSSIAIEESGEMGFMGMRLAGMAPGDRFISISVEGEGFLKQMVRNIVGTLVEAGKGRLGPAEVSAILESRDRNNAGPTAPACGLFMAQVRYG